MSDGAWGNNSDKAMAIFAAAAFIISLSHVLWDIFIRPHREDKSQAKAREEQNRWRTDLETKITNDQIMWQDKLDRRQEARQAKWRQEEEERLARWRKEDIARQEASFDPKLEVTFETELKLMNRNSGISETRLYTTAVNIGTIPVFFSNWGGIKIDNEDVTIECPKGVDPTYCGDEFDFTRPLAIGQRARTYFDLSELRVMLGLSGRKGTVRLRGYVVDQRGTSHFSEPYSVNLDND